MTYQELLLSSQWQKKRTIILNRDNNKCNKCSNDEILKSATFVFYIDNDNKSSKLSFNHFDTVEHENIIKLNYLKYAPLPRDGLLAISTTLNENFQILASRVFDKEETYEYIIKRKDIIKEIFKNHNDVTTDDFCNYSINKILRDPSEIDKFITNIKIENLIADIEKNTNTKEKFIKINSNECDWVFYTGLHVHHTYYKYDTLPWEYPNDALVTLCWICHENEHKDSEMPVFNESGIEIDKLPLCKRCYGAGYLPQYNYHQGGRCFRCDGSRFEIEGLNRLNSKKSF